MCQLASEPSINNLRELMLPRGSCSHDATRCLCLLFVKATGAGLVWAACHEALMQDQAKKALLGFAITGLLFPTVLLCVFCALQFDK